MDLEVKNEAEAVELAEAGNKCYKERNFFQALNFYNGSLCHSVSSYNKTRAYANKSAVYFELKLFDLCAKNIKFALSEGGYSEEKVKKLKERLQKCENNLKQKLTMKIEKDEKLIENFFKISHKKNEKIPFIVDCIEVRESDKFGRGIFAMKDLKAGDIIAIEEPFFKIIRESARYKRCCYCLKSENFDLIPCVDNGKNLI
jgi:SET and MYND domain-containing protein 4